jgi:hypothetical protein
VPFSNNALFSYCFPCPTTGGPANCQIIVTVSHCDFFDFLPGFCAGAGFLFLGGGFGIEREELLLVPMADFCLNERKDQRERIPSAPSVS